MTNTQTHPQVHPQAAPPPPPPPAPAPAERPRPRPRPQVGAAPLAGAVAGAVSGAVSNATGAVRNVTGTATTTASNATGAVGNAVSQAAGAVPGVGAVPGAVGSAVGSAVADTSKAVTTLGSQAPLAVKDNLVTDMAKSAVTSPGDIVGFSGLARYGASTVWRAIGNAVKGTIDSGKEIVKEVQSGEPVIDIIDERVEAVRNAAWNALGLKDHTDDLLQGSTRNSSYRDLRAAGDRLLERSCDESSQPRNEHPAFVAILQELAPDEARILRFLALAGPQPAIDVRTKTPFGVGSERLAGGINMIADMAGCTYPDRNQQYLANLNRLGMVRFSEEQVEDPRRYSLIEAQPIAAEAMAKAKKAVTVYRSIYLSLFGKQFCEVCFTMDGYDAGGWIRDVR